MTKEIAIMRKQGLEGEQRKASKKDRMPKRKQQLRDSITADEFNFILA